MPERGADDIQQEIEQARVSLAGAVDQIAYRTSPKRVGDSVKATVVARAQSPAGKAVIGAAGAVLLLLIIRRVNKH